MNTVAVLTADPHTRSLFWTAHFPLDDVRVKPDPEAAAVKVAQVPVVYHLPALMMQPVGLLEVETWRVPRPEKGIPGVVVPVGEGAVVVGFVVVDGGGGLVPPEDLGRYLMPVEGQEDLEPSSRGEGEV